jgi:septal ring factor EnvC (AmiA/AmiB activator)
MQEADREALRNMEDTTREVSKRVNQLVADREELTQAASQARTDLAAAQESLTAKKAALEKAMDANRRNGCVTIACLRVIPCGPKQRMLTHVVFSRNTFLCVHGAP